MKLKMLEESDKATFVSKVNRFLKSIGDRLFSVKFQRNLYYSLSGSTNNPKEIHKETSHLKEGYVAFIIYRELEGT